MTHQAWIDDSSFARTQLDELLYLKWTRYLPAGYTGHCAGHSIRGFRYAFAIARPERIIEIGFHCGHSAVISLHVGCLHVTSVDISSNPDVAEAARMVKARFPGRFEFINADSRSVEIDGQFDMIFIDGDHSYDGIMSDIRLGQKLGVNWFFFDDWQPRFAATQEAIAASRLIPIAVFGNLVLCMPSDGLIGVPIATCKQASIAP